MNSANPFVPEGEPTASGTVDRRTALVPESRTLGRYRLRYRFARGGMASVYLAQLTGGDQSFRKWVAVKTMHPHLVEDQHFVQMFMSEAKLGARLNHPNVCNVFDVGQESGTYYLAMEYLHGEPLNSVLRQAREQGGLPIGIGAKIVADAARGLHACHELCLEDGKNAGVVHRDVSPPNIFILYEGVAKVVDFGVARVGGDELTIAGEVKGKLAYMAPEQIRGQEIDRRADIFALGVVLWEATVGARLFGGRGKSDDASVVTAVISSKITPPSQVVPGYPAELEHIVMRALAREPKDRFQTAAGMARALDVFLARIDDVIGPAEVGELMQRLFGERIAVRDALLRRQHMSILPPAAQDEATAERKVKEVSSRPPLSPKSTAPPPRRGWSAVTMFTGILGALVAGAGGTWWFAKNPHLLARMIQSQTAISPEQHQDARTAPNHPPSSVAIPDPPPTAAQAAVDLQEPEARGAARHVRPAALPVFRGARHYGPAPGSARTAATTGAASPTPAQAATGPTAPLAPLPTSAPAAPRLVLATATPPTSAPAPVAPAAQPAAPAQAAIQSVRGTLAGLRGNGIAVMPLSNRAAAAASSLGQCVTREARARNATSAFESQVRTTVVLEVRDRRVDTARLRGGPGWLNACLPAARSAFSGNMPEGNDAEYSVEIDVGLTGQR